VSVTRGTVIKVAAVSGATGTARSVEEEGAEVAGDEETIERLILCLLKLQNDTKRTRSMRRLNMAPSVRWVQAEE
jgi:hypothetical protein